MVRPASQHGTKSLLLTLALVMCSFGLVSSQVENNLNETVLWDEKVDYFSAEVQAAGDSRCRKQYESDYSGDFGREDYEKVLTLSWEFFKAQRSGKVPKDYSVSWRKSSHEDDPVPGGWYDAGDYLKLNFPLAYSVAMISWGMNDFKKGYIDSGVYCDSKEALRHAVSYLMDCHVSDDAYIGQIGHPDIDHSYWGRAHEQKGSRPKFVWKKGMKAADLFSKVSAALSAASDVFEDDKTFSKTLIEHAEDLYALAKKSPGQYSSHYKSATQIYASSEWEDDMAWAAAWLYKVTRRESYLMDSVRYWRRKYWDVSASWDSSGAMTAFLLYQLHQEGAPVGSFKKIEHFVEKKFLTSWINGKGEIVETPKGLSHPSWSRWGNLQLSTASAFLALSYVKHTKSTSLARKAARWSRSQVDYALGSSGRSFVVGFGKNYPKYPHHAGASCPDEPATCNWSDFESKKPNPQILYGALVGGPSGPGDNTYHDKRDDYITNEVAVDYSAAFTGALAALVEMT